MIDSLNYLQTTDVVIKRGSGKVSKYMSEFLFFNYK